MEKFLSLNNEGVDYLLARNYAAAEKSLKAAFMQVGQIQDDYKKLLQEKKIDAPQHGTIDDLILLSRKVEESPKTLSCNKHRYIYRYAIVGVLDLHDSVRGESELPHNTSGLTAIVTYNIALCYHCNKLEYDSKPGQIKVLRLYRFALRALQNSPYASCKVLTDMTTLGIYNNMGAIHFKLSNYLESDGWFEKVKAIRDGTRFSSFPDEARLGMLVNLKHIGISRPASAA
mmetsp:Transcript_27542/g.41673  ORF Transcript_27542/g.41673 Transcript_27542/m.41673 type:complete len:230 (+) Transcript_27542:128-817(+)|eukprot:CAMPEP_0178913418 /NCGR_PEP_ID=MMETSP0786-20121207/10830_1 /TAXON_ID=186022 /ORGANISM="Thalassionema frauenfeldii, Strain CCMP 1798" /LENGTH=229 /DNA_ID=CAMNT_0020586155 /DNA_START=96 /DNA_END=785 /DNA_ORIENTATION=-